MLAYFRLFLYTYIIKSAEAFFMKHIKVIAKSTICREKGTGCGECQSSCQSACKTSCTVGNQSCEQKKINNVFKESK